MHADDGALWKRGRNVIYTANRTQTAINQAEKCVMRRGFRLSIAPRPKLYASEIKINIFQLV